MKIILILTLCFFIIFIMNNLKAQKMEQQKYKKSINSIQYLKIPKLLHIIWIGNKNPPKTLETWTNDFTQDNPGWVVKIWKDKDINNLNLINKKSYNSMKEYCGKADIARYEIIYRYGGMYIDADTMWLNRFNENVLMSGLINLSFEYDKPLIMNTWFSAVPNHPFFKKIIDEIPKRDLKKPAWISVGPTLVTKVYNDNKTILDINFVDIKNILCPLTWGGINPKDHDKYIKICKDSEAFGFHWGLSTNSKEK
jgi:mannosyltransferase OCH1-like enzyme